MEQLYWTALTIEFSGAGVYLGFAPVDEHELVASRLTQKQARAFSGGTISVRSDRVSPLRYYAVRDPSAVKVKPVERPTADGSRHVQLIFGFSKARAAAATGGVEVEACDGSPAAWPMPPTGYPAFIVTIGLPIEREEAFHEHIVCAEPKQSLAELCRRVEEAARSLP